MSLLTLQNIGKIYVSDGNIAVGIRGVNLSFDKGEFVAITGKSGSGKSTLLNVISGMDTYEEGELLIEGQPTSYYLQPEWEAYRQKYISFIFQDYNIIESYTVLQNVELALMHIEDRRERRRRALALLDRVGMSRFIRQKGSRLSGGQKQRTVIARALAKDSPIILADEPTGNLDSATSKEIIDLLREVSRDKLLIIVTHNYEEVEHCATRHVRIFDGAVESDTVLENPLPADETPRPEEKRRRVTGREIRRKDISDGLTLGKSIFTSRPRLSLFMCLLMIIGTLGVFFTTALCGDAVALFEKHYMFTHIDGRLILTHTDGSAITEEELATIARDTGALSTLHYDILLESGEDSYSYLDRAGSYEHFRYVFNEDFGDADLGRYPAAANEVLLWLPISYRTAYGTGDADAGLINLENTDFAIVGIKYYYDNNLTPKVLLTEEGFRNLTALYYLSRSYGQSQLSVQSSDFSSQDFYFGSIFASFEVEQGKIYIYSPKYREYLKSMGSDDQPNSRVALSVSYTYQNYNYGFFDHSTEKIFHGSFDESYLTDESVPLPRSASQYYGDDCLFIAVDLLTKIADRTLEESYRQASVFYENDAVAHIAAESLDREKYIAVPSDTTFNPDPYETILSTVGALFVAVGWFLAIVFLAFFIYLCSARTLGAFKGDMAIMRSMGIPVRVIRIGMYVRMFLSLIPAFLLVVAAAVLIYLSPALNGFFSYLYLWQYALIFFGMLLLTYRVTRKQIRKLFGESVKSALRGGATE